jgi:hypothetical protein
MHGVAAEEDRHQAPPVNTAAEDAAAIAFSTSAPHPSHPVPPTPERRASDALFYSDMGPDTIDVSSYSAQQRHNYEIYSQACSRCHTLARSVNAPIVGRGWWEFYMLGMRVRSRREGRPIPPQDVKAILEFLEYDSRVRKADDSHNFDALTEELKKRFDASLSKRLKALQENNPHILPTQR